LDGRVREATPKFLYTAFQRNTVTDHVGGLDPERFAVSPDRGFVADPDPQTAFDADAPRALARFDRIAETLPKRLEAGSLRATLDDLAVPPGDVLADLDPGRVRRLYRLGGFLASAYIHRIDGPEVQHVPAGVAVPLVAAADRLERTPMLSYDGYVLENWRRSGPNETLTPESVRAGTTFSRFPDEEWFIAIHVAIEAAAGRALSAVGDVREGTRTNDPDRVRGALETVAAAIEEAAALLGRMEAGNDPRNYDQGFRPYLKPFEGIEYRGTDLDGPQSFRGGSGAQSSLFPALDGVLGIEHDRGPLVSYLHDLRRDMPPAHRAFVEEIESGPSLRSFIAESDDPALREAYAECIDRTVEFRERHTEVVSTYLSDDDQEGTGGTPYAPFLDGFIEDTREARL
jgi:indoleamine 2,3-dioxygenase